MSKSPPSFAFYYNDFAGGTSHLTPEAVGCYVRLMIYQFQNGSIPRDPAMLSRISICSLEQWNRIWPEIQDKFEAADGSGDRMVNPRMASEREINIQNWEAAKHKRIRLTRQEISEIRSDAGRKGAEKRWQNDGKTEWQNSLKPQENMANDGKTMAKNGKWEEGKGKGNREDSFTRASEASSLGEPVAPPDPLHRPDGASEASSSGAPPIETPRRAQDEPRSSVPSGGFCVHREWDPRPWRKLGGGINWPQEWLDSLEDETPETPETPANEPKPTPVTPKPSSTKNAAGANLGASTSIDKIAEHSVTWNGRQQTIRLPITVDGPDSVAAVQEWITHCETMGKSPPITSLEPQLAEVARYNPTPEKFCDRIRACVRDNCDPHNFRPRLWYQQFSAQKTAEPEEEDPPRLNIRDIMRMRAEGVNI